MHTHSRIPGVKHKEFRIASGKYCIFQYQTSVMQQSYATFYRNISKSPDAFACIQHQAARLPPKLRASTERSEEIDAARIFSDISCRH